QDAATELPDGATWMSDVDAAIDQDRARREAEEAVTVRGIAQQAKSSTKEAIGDRAATVGSEVVAGRDQVVDHREPGAAARGVARHGAALARWDRSASLDSKAPQQARQAAELAATGRVPER